MESRPLADFALDPNPPPHLLHKSRRDGKAKTGSTIVASCRAVGLSERFKNQRLLVGGNSHPRVRDTKMQAIVNLFLRLGHNFHHDLAALGKFDRVVNEVDQDLAKP